MLVINQDICAISSINNTFKMPIHSRYSNDYTLLINQYRDQMPLKVQEIIAESDNLSTIPNILKLSFNDRIVDARAKGKSGYKKGNQAFDEEIEEICMQYFGEIKKRKKILGII
jgi:hypothetical protein